MILVFLAAESEASLLIEALARNQERLDAQAISLEQRSRDVATSIGARQVASEAAEFLAKHPRHWMAKRILTDVGAAFARAGDLSAALRIWHRARHLADPTDAYGQTSSSLDDHVAAAYELRGDFWQALAARRRWRPMSFCGNCVWALEREREAAIARCLIHLGRREEARPWILKSRAADPFYIGSPRSPAQWIWAWHPHWQGNE